jgi:hypothetical protein
MRKDQAMPGMLPIDRARKLSDQARERFTRARRRFTLKRAQVKDRARSYDDGAESPPPDEHASPDPSSREDGAR